jgi:Divergent InlB B-repeat domain
MLLFQGKNAVKRITGSYQSAFMLSLLSLILLVPSIAANVIRPVQNTSLLDSDNINQNVSLLPASSRFGTNLLLGRPGAMAYDEQLGMTFTQDSGSLAYTVIAVAQKGTDNYGPAYLLNGLGNTGYWYQVGLSYNWDPGIATGFQLAYSVFDPSGNLVLPTTNGAGLAAISPVNPGDSVLLSLSFANGNVIMRGIDQNTGAQAQETYTASGATVFSGVTSEPSNAQGFFSGLMTEWYHSTLYTGSEQGVTYTTQGASITSAWLWMDEFAVSSRGIGSTVFSNFTNTPVAFTGTSPMQTLSSNGALVSANANQFITGQLAATVQLTFSYAVSGGSGNASAPVLTYTTGGAVKTAALTLSGQVFSVDSSTAWSVTGQLPSSTATERWITSQTTTGTAAAVQSANFVFSHQYYITVNLVPLTGGGVSTASGWFDAGAQFQSTASANSGWQFESWSGSGDGAYSGNNNTTAAVVMAPLTETAAFSPGLTINTAANLFVRYSWDGVEGEVSANNTGTVYAPAGTAIQLNARPTLFIYAFKGWTGLATGKSSNLSVVLTGPQIIYTGSGASYLNIWIVCVAVILIIAAIIVIIIRRNKKTAVTSIEDKSGTQ